MAGSWEIKQQTSVLAYSLHTDVCTIAWAVGLRNLIIPGHYLPIAGMPYDHARNACCQQCLQGGYEWLFSLDSDVIPPRDAILRLMSHRLPIVSGVYHRRSPPAGVPVMQKPAGQWLLHYPANKLIEVDVVGAGLLLIHRSVLERLPPQRPEAGKTFFDWRVDCEQLCREGKMPANMPPMSEDFTMMVHAKNYGYKIMVDTGVQAKHVGLAEAGYGSFNPLNVTPIT